MSRVGVERLENRVVPQRILRHASRIRVSEWFESRLNVDSCVLSSPSAPATESAPVAHSLSPPGTMGTPLELVKYNVEDGKFVVGKEAVEVLRKVGKLQC